MTVRYSRRSLTQIANIIAAFAVDDPPTATMFARRVETLARLLASHPSIGRQTDFAGIRVLPMKPYPYLIFYQPDPAGAGITVLRSVIWPATLTGEPDDSQPHRSTKATAAP